MNIAVFLPNWIGDVVMATPALRAVRDQFPSAEIVGVMRPYVADVLAGTGTLALARERAIEYAEAAHASLSCLNHSPYAEALSAIPTYIIERDR